VKVIGNDASNLSTAQKASLSNGGAVAADDVVKWLKGQTITGFRDRTHGIIGDIVNASPTYVSNNLNFNYMKITDPCVANTGGASYASGTGCTGGKLYQSYVDGNATRDGIVYFGANDGQLHAVNAATGAEVMSFIPNGVFSSFTDTNENGLQNAGELVDNKLFALSQPYYAHRYFLDATPVVGDVWNGSAWKTWLVSGLGAGGRSIFAMDVTSPAGIEVQWEFNHPDLGYTFGKPIIARLQSGEWVVLVANGYDSGGTTALLSDRARLFILDAFTGAVIANIDTGVGSAALPNGLTGTEVVLDSNRTVKGVYGGDLLGNVWYFDLVNKTVPGTWGSPTAARKLFTATDSLGQAQPITGGIEVGAIPGVSGTLVLFGTGKYFEVLDAAYTGAPKEDTFYAILDKGSLVNKSDLDKRIYAPVGTGYRTTNSVPSGATTVDYTSKKGWKLDLMEASKYEGEKVISQPLLRQGRIIFVSIVPENADRCVGGGSSWLTEVDAMTGLPLTKPVFDTNNDGRIDGDDDANISGYGDSTGILSDPTIVEGNLKDSNDTNTETKIQSSTGGLSITTTLEDKSSPIPAAGVGRMSWQQLQ
jgi:type IV pilus assembly protein PilY1